MGQSSTSEVQQVTDWVVADIRRRYERVIVSGASTWPPESNLAPLLAICEDAGIQCFGVRNTDHLKACLVDPVGTGWMLVYQCEATVHQQFAYVLHELAEFIMRSMDASSDYPAIDGCVHDLRHIVAQRVVKALLPTPPVGVLVGQHGFVYRCPENVLVAPE